MLMPSIFRDNLFDDFMMNPWRSDFFNTPSDRKYMMSTDVKENDDTYELDIELPGYKKEDVHAELNNGYLTISASKNENRDEKDVYKRQYLSCVQRGLRCGYSSGNCGERMRH